MEYIAIRNLTAGALVVSPDGTESATLTGFQTARRLDDGQVWRVTARFVEPGGRVWIIDDLDMEVPVADGVCDCGAPVVDNETGYLADGEAVCDDCNAARARAALAHIYSDSPALY